MSIQNLKKAVINIKDYMTKSPFERMLLEATSEEVSICPINSLKHISISCYEFEFYQMTKNHIWSNIKEKTPNARKMMKTLILVEYLIINSSEELVNEFKEEIFYINLLKDFKSSENFPDMILAVREKAKIIVDLLEDTDRLMKLRLEAQKIYERIAGIGSDDKGLNNKPKTNQDNNKEKNEKDKKPSPNKEKEILDFSKFSQSKPQMMSELDWIDWNKNQNFNPFDEKKPENNFDEKKNSISGDQKKDFSPFNEIKAIPKENKQNSFDNKKFSFEGTIELKKNTSKSETVVKKSSIINQNVPDLLDLDDPWKKTTENKQEQQIKSFVEDTANKWNEEWNKNDIWSQPNPRANSTENLNTNFISWDFSNATFKTNNDNNKTAVNQPNPFENNNQNPFEKPQSFNATPIVTSNNINNQFSQTFNNSNSNANQFVVNSNNTFQTPNNIPNKSANPFDIPAQNQIAFNKAKTLEPSLINNDTLNDPLYKKYSDIDTGLIDLGGLKVEEKILKVEKQMNNLNNTTNLLLTKPEDWEKFFKD